MSKIDLLVKAWDEAIWEFSQVFEGLEDADVWRRPHPNLLSIGELAGHLAYYEAVMSAEPALAEGSGVSELAIQSVLIDPAFKYFTDQIHAPVVLSIGSSMIIAELKRIHAEARTSVLAVDRDSEAAIVGRDKATWGSYVQYLGFHAAYHAGQAYSVRHLFGQTPVDN